jgi:hypothetical protein
MIKGSDKHETVGEPIPNTEMKVVHPETRSSLAVRDGRNLHAGPTGERGEGGLSGFAAFHT